MRGGECKLVSLVLVAFTLAVRRCKENEADSTPLIPRCELETTRSATASDHSLALRSDGTLIGWGSNSLGQINVPDGTFMAIAAGDTHSLALRADSLPVPEPLSLLMFGGIASLAALIIQHPRQG